MVERKDPKVKVATHFLWIFPRAIKELAKLTDVGMAQGLSPSAFLDIGDDAYADALARHLVGEGQGRIDHSGLHHAVHEAWNAMARLEILLKKEEEDG